MKTRTSTMHGPRHHARPNALVVAVLAGLFPLVLGSCGEGERRDAAPRSAATPSAPAPETTAPRPRTRALRFVDGLEAAAESGGDEDALWFVYVGRHHPT